MSQQQVRPSIFWHDYETTGIDPRADRPLQIAGIRTDEALNPIDEPINLDCQISDDILPHPQACLVTGITPERLQQGLPEVDFMQQVHAQLSLPGTCGAGYNSLRFDDEVTRNSLYRNFYDPYAREWQGGNSRWDLIDVVRTAYALRPSGIEWPQVDGLVSLKLEALTACNGIVHGHAHDALSDVQATIDLARLIRTQQPRLFDYLYQHRAKQRLLAQIELLKPMVHISGQFGAQRHYLAIVLPLAWHPTNRNALIVADLGKTCTPLIDEDAEVLRQRLYTRREALGDALPVPLKLVHINRCPVLLPLTILRNEDRQRLGLEVENCLQQAQYLLTNTDKWQDKLAEIYAQESFSGIEDSEQGLYRGFIKPRDRQLCDRVRAVLPEYLARDAWPFDDERLPELLFRYRARNYPQTLSAQEQQRWQTFCQQRLTDKAYGAPNTLADFVSEAQRILPSATAAQREVLQAWLVHAEGLVQRFALAMPGDLAE